jgi:hypothetical protein
VVLAGLGCHGRPAPGQQIPIDPTAPDRAQWGWPLASGRRCLDPPMDWPSCAPAYRRRSECHVWGPWPYLYSTVSQRLPRASRLEPPCSGGEFDFSVALSTKRRRQRTGTRTRTQAWAWWDQQRALLARARTELEAQPAGQSSCSASSPARMSISRLCSTSLYSPASSASQVIVCSRGSTISTSSTRWAA